jgi:hypothetical protein
MSLGNSKHFKVGPATRDNKLALALLSPSRLCSQIHFPPQQSLAFFTTTEQSVIANRLIIVAMADNNRVNSLPDRSVAPPGGSGTTTPERTARGDTSGRIATPHHPGRIPTEFPLNLSIFGERRTAEDTLVLQFGSYLAAQADLAEARDPDERREALQRHNNFQHQLDGHQGGTQTMSDPATLPPPAPAGSDAHNPVEKAKMPITTLLSALPKTTYNDAEDTSEKSSEYIGVQRALLKYLATHASDSLAPRQAYAWTEAISSDKKPKAQDTLRLCYYMRSQGFDTYAHFKGTLLLLYIVHPRAKWAYPEQDGLYWMQDYKTNVIPDNPLADEAAEGRARRNAIVSDLSARIGAPLPPDQGGAGGAEEGNEQAAEPTQSGIRELYRTAEAHLHFLLSSNAGAAYVYPPFRQKLLISFSSAIETAITQVERYRVQLAG